MKCFYAALIALLLAFASSTRAEVTCDVCHAFGDDLSTGLTSGDSLYVQILLYIREICPSYDDLDECAFNVYTYWPSIGTQIFPVFLNATVLCQDFGYCQPAAILGHRDPMEYEPLNIFKKASVHKEPTDGIVKDILKKASIYKEPTDGIVKEPTDGTGKEPTDGKDIDCDGLVKLTLEISAAFTTEKNVADILAFLKAEDFCKGDIACDTFVESFIPKAVAFLGLVLDDLSTDICWQECC